MPSSYLHYDIIEKLGEGGMGLVYLAKDTKLNRYVALKFLPRHISNDEIERKRFRQEAQSAAFLNHPNIAQVYAIEEVDDQLFIVLEYIEGKELKELVEEETLTVDEKWELALEIAQGINAAHKKGIVHRDIKSRNIMINESGTAKIMDFGLARMEGADRITKTGTTIGTTAYMAPEQLTGEEIDMRSDIWSYGVVLYELFTKSLPFDGAYEPAIMYAITENDPVPISDHQKEVPERIVHVIERCLEKNRTYRYQTFEEVLNDLISEKTTPVKRPHQTTSKKNAASKDYTGYLVAAVAAAVLLLAFIYISRDTNLNLTGNSIPDKKYLAVLPIENIGEDPDLQVLSVGLAETFSYRLSELEKYEESYWVTPAGEIRKENVRSATQAHKIFGVNLAISSTIQAFGDSTRLILELVDADNIRRLETVQIVVASENLASLEKDGIKAMLAMLDIQINPEINQTINQGDTSDPEAYEYYLRGRAALQMYNSPDSLKQAVELFKKSIALDPEFTLGYSGLGESYWRLYQDTGEVPYVSQAEDALNEALELNENLAQVQMLLGLLKSGTGNYREAEKIFEKALEMDPKHTPALRGLAGVYAEMGDPKKAVETYRKAIDLKPEYWEGHKGLAIHYLSTGDFENAIKEFTMVTRLTPDNSSAYSNLGAAYLYNGENDRAREMFVKSMSLEKNSAAANNLAYLYFTGGKYQQAAEMYEVVLQDYPNRYQYWGNLAVAYEYSGEEKKSEEAYLTAIDRAKDQLEVNPRNAEVLADLGAYYSDVKDTTQSLEFMRRALNVDSENIMVRERAVSTYESLGMREEALKWINASIITTIETQPELQDLIKDPRFRELAEKFKE
ncbi:protein kinase [Balneolaceae bacterium YR4-1]|uniref:non-specific serine/threonine protein kinase n=1 Tax=Halalkalibaculum roseum TaxID=2709311 RepID=A0A6M1SVE9_9BACT|nr:serine/threonine-protein kinase [Halalkalibaculum roseum]NGP76106.1 protein kinase [Halalkalibaculum roseum]